jgi:membrane protein required for colicin V production
MNLLDIIIIVAMIILIVRGIFRGFFKEVGSLAGVILGIWFANDYQPQMTEYLKAYLTSVKYLPLISFGIIFIIVFILCNISGWGMKMILKRLFFNWADRTLGAGLAFVKCVFITYFVIIMLTFFIPSKTPLIAQSRLAPLIIVSYQSMASLISPDYYQKWKSKLLGQKKKMGDAVSEKPQGSTRKDGLK